MRFLTPDQVRQIDQQAGSPVFVYSELELEQAAKALLAFPNLFGLVVRYAMKACPERAILQLLDRLGLCIDASSGYEVHRALAAGIKPEKIQLTCQELPADIIEPVLLGVRLNACSLHQLQVYGQLLEQHGIDPKAECRNVSIRVNPGLGSGHCNRTNTGGPSSSFGIWHEYLDQAIEIAKKYGLTINRLHTHIGSGSDPEVWVKVAEMSLAIAERLPDVTVLNLGGGFKVGRVPSEKTTDLQVCGEAVKTAFDQFAKKTGRKLWLEIEPGTYVVAAAGSIVTRVIDVVDTNPEASGYVIVKTDSGMTENTRPALYGAQHPVVVVPDSPDEDGGEMIEQLFVGHCCESGDTITPAPGNPEAIASRLTLKAKIGYYVVVEFAGAYCEAMNCAGYNSFPAAASVLIRKDGTILLIRKRQTQEQLWQNEIGLPSAA